MKLKTHRGAAKRFRKTKSGKFKSASSNHTHILTKKTPKRKRRARHTHVASKSESPKIKRMMPYA